MGIFTAACMCLVLGQSAGDTYYTNQRGLGIPVHISEAARAEYLEFRLFASTDQGRSWQQAGVISSSKKEFAYYATSDGSYWFQVATVNRQGAQEPDDRTVMRGSPQLKMVIDTARPVMKSFQAQRFGDEIAVAWDIQEAHLDRSKDGVKLEYQVKDAPVESWKTVQVPSELRGQVTINPGTPGAKQPLVLRLSVRDLAGNQSYAQGEVSGTITTTGFNAPADEKKTPPADGGIKPPMFPIDEPLEKKAPIDLPKMPILPPGDMPKIPPPSEFKGNAIVPPGDFKPGPIVMPAKDKEVPKDKVVADSRANDSQITAAGMPGEALSLKPRKPLTPAQYVNQHLVKLQYEIRRFGPSGIGGVEIWLTKDDGASWEPYAKVSEAEVGKEAVQGKQERDFEFIDERGSRFSDGTYGLNLVVKNRGGLGRTPRAGDAPEIRIEIDTEKPFVQLLEPAADPQNPGQLLLKWYATDKNLAAAPINLEYSEKLDGSWQPIQLGLANSGRYAGQKATGDYSWKVPPGTPVQVYLRVRVRDKAGNEGIAVTPTPQYVDLIEPEGSLLGVLPQNKR